MTDIDLTNTTGLDDRLVIDALISHVLKIEKTLYPTDGNSVAYAYNTDVGYTLIMSAIIFFMQTGFSMVEAGSVSRFDSIRKILLMNVLDTCVVAVIWYLWGYAFGFGKGTGANGFIGTNWWGLSGSIVGNKYSNADSYTHWFFHFTFCSTSCTIVSGALAERTRIRAYIIFCVIFAGWIYPLIAHWAWCTDGFMTVFLDPVTVKSRLWLGNGYIDFAGSGVVHLIGGTCAFWGAFIVGPRMGRWEEHFLRKGVFEPQSPGWICLGTLILWFCWYGFNGGSTTALSGEQAAVASVVFVNTTIAAGSAGLCALFWAQAIDKTWNLTVTLNGILAGLVGITAGCATVEPWGAFIVGVTSATAYYWASKAQVKIRIDDPLEASIVHGVCGTWGVICVGLLSSKENIRSAFRSPPERWADYEVTSYGLLLGGGWGQFGIQIVAVLIIFAWTSIWSIAVFWTMNRIGILRVSAPHEKKSFQSRLDEISQKKAIRELAYEEKYESGTETPMGETKPTGGKNVGRGEVRVIEDPDSEDDDNNNNNNNSKAPTSTAPRETTKVGDNDNNDSSNSNNKNNNNGDDSSS